MLGTAQLAPSFSALGGPSAARLLAANGDPGVLRPFLGPDGQSYQYRRTGKTGKDGKPEVRMLASNADATLLHEEWKLFDRTVLEVQRAGLSLVRDIASQPGLRYRLADAMSVPVLMHQTSSDFGSATMSMNGVRKGDRDRGVFGQDGIPIPIIHFDTAYDMREVLVSRRMGIGLDTAAIFQGTQRCLELAEDLYMGVLDPYTYAGVTLYGLLNFVGRIAASITAPTTAGWTPETTVTEILGILQTLSNYNYPGPFGCYFSRGWTRYLGGDYKDTYGGETLQSRLEKLNVFRFMRRLDRMTTDFKILIFQLSPNAIQAVEGMAFRPVQWETPDGMGLGIKIYGITVPRIRKNHDNLVPIVEGSS